TLAVAAAAGFDRPVVIGHSLGGLVALACAARPDAVRAAVLVDSAPILNERHKAFFARTAEDIAADANGDWRRGYIGKLLPPSDTHRRAEIIAGAGALPPAVAAATWRAIARFDGAAALREARVPILSIHAARPDERLREQHPDVTIGQTVGSGHFNQLQVPDQVNAMIARFLESYGL
ncbi:MAG: alpha/beta fold hydrolase, partial [Streptomyces sp.]